MMRALGIGLLGAVSLLPIQARGYDFSKADLSGDWYVLVRFKDSTSEDKSIEKFKDFAWSIEQTPNTLTWEWYPYVVFDDDTEQIRRHAMMNFLHWTPTEDQWKALELSLPVSARAMQRKRMKGNPSEGFRSLPPLASGGFNTLTFSRQWEVRYSPEKVNVVIVDSLSGSGGLEGMDEAIVYTIDQRVSPTELRGTYREGTKSGRFRMVKSHERKVVK